MNKKEAGTRARGNFSKLLWKTTDQDQEEEATSLNKYVWSAWTWTSQVLPRLSKHFQLPLWQMDAWDNPEGLEIVPFSVIG